MKASYLSRFLYILSWIAIACFGALLVTLPWIVSSPLPFFQGLRELPRVPALVFLYIAAVPFGFLLFGVKKLCANIMAGNPFCPCSIQALTVIRLCAFLDFLLFLFFTLFMYPRLTALVIMLAACLVTLLSAVLLQLFKTGLALQEENDLTI